MGSIRWSGSIRCGLCFSQVMPFLCELLPRTAKYELNWPAFSCSAASLLYPNPGGPRQPLDRQLRYYSEAFPLASVL
jgi:hypothetical protein